MVHTISSVLGNVASVVSEEDVSGLTGVDEGVEDGWSMNLLHCRSSSSCRQ